MVLLVSCLILIGLRLVLVVFMVLVSLSGLVGDWLCVMVKLVLKRRLRIKVGGLVLLFLVRSLWMILMVVVIISLLRRVSLLGVILVVVNGVIVLRLV